MGKKIGIVTILGTNIGNRLQNYALERVLNRMGYECDTIDRHKSNLFGSRIRLKDLLVYQNLKLLLAILLNRRNIRTQQYDGDFFRRTWRFWQFNKKYLHLKSPLCIASGYDYYIVGSDQVWNPDFIKGRDMFEYFFLQFAQPEQRLSYAASFGVGEIPERYRLDYSKWLKGFAKLSVREESGVGLVQQLTGRDTALHVDPTLLLSGEEWSAFEKKPVWYDDSKNYLVTYFLGQRNEAVEKAMKEDAAAQNLEFIHIFDRSNPDWYGVDPCEFVYLLHHGAKVYTDSFHATVFSIIFARPFVVCERQDVFFAGKHNMNSRIDTLLSHFGLVCCETAAGRECCNFDILAIAKILEQQQAVAREYLGFALRKKS